MNTAGPPYPWNHLSKAFISNKNHAFSSVSTQFIIQLVQSVGNAFIRKR